MPRSRGSELSQRPSPRGPPSLRTSSSDSDPPHPRQITDRSPKIGDRRSPRSVQSDPVNQKKLGTRIADLESQLGNAQDELRNLKNQLASAEAAKKEAQEKLEKKAKKPAEKKVPKLNDRERKPSNEITEESLELEETDVFEVPIEKPKIEPKSEASPLSELDENLSLEKLAVKDEEIKSLRETLVAKEKEASAIGEENETLKTQLNEANANISSARSKEEEMVVKLSELRAELEASESKNVQLVEQVKSVEEAKELMEIEMKKIRVQTEQWRKAADAAAAILAGGGDVTGRIPGRCGSMDKHFDGVFETGFLGSPADDVDDGFGGGKRKGSGIKMFGDLWRKKGPK